MRRMVRKMLMLTLDKTNKKPQMTEQFASHLHMAAIYSEQTQAEKQKFGSITIE
jgi:hypothetical protein